MYKAIITQINGTKVLAGGKWLTCIGNKPVKVGDSVWTDGRCVYGNDEECQTPIVITPKDLGIPISVLNSNVYLTFTSKLLENKGNSRFTNKNTKIINDAKGNVYKTSVLAANVDNFGNSYTMRQKSGTIYENDNIKFVREVVIRKNNEDVTVIDINQKLYPLQSIAGEIISAELSSNGSYIQDGEYPRYYSIGVTHIISGKWMTESGWENYAVPFKLEPYYVPTFSVIWANINNAEDWAFIVNVGYSGTATVKKRGEMTDELISQSAWEYIYGDFEYFLDLTDGEIAAVAYASYLVTPSGTQLLFQCSGHYGGVIKFVNGEPFECIASGQDGRPESRGIFYCDPYDGVSHRQWELLGESNNLDIDSAAGIKIPLPDKFYYCIDSFPPLPKDEIMLPAFANISIYAPNDKKIFSGVFSIGSRIAVHKTKNGYLIAVDDVQSNLVFPYSMAIKGEDFQSEYYNHDNLNNYLRSEHITSGLYLCKNGELTLLVEGWIMNQYLRPMKNYKNWWNKIQNLT